jgi:hypothetical protein
MNCSKVYYNVQGSTTQTVNKTGERSPVPLWEMQELVRANPDMGALAGVKDIVSSIPDAFRKHIPI